MENFNWKFLALVLALMLVMVLVLAFTPPKDEGNFSGCEDPSLSQPC